MKTKCIFITGTNAVGKSSLAQALIDHYGGVDRIVNDVTYCRDGKTSFAGKYGVTVYGGVDRIVNDKGSSCTSLLASVVERALQTQQRIICEGSFMNTFGINLTNALFKAQDWLVVNLYAPNDVLWARLQKRSDGKNGVRTVENIRRVFNKQRQSMIAARKYQSIGVPVIQINTVETAFEEEVKQVIKAIEL